MSLPTRKTGHSRRTASNLAGIVAIAGVLAFQAAGCGDRPAPQSPVRLPTETATASSTDSPDTSAPTAEQVETLKNRSSDKFADVQSSAAETSSSGNDAKTPIATAANAELAASADVADAELPPFAHGEWVSLFDGKSIDGWTATKFGGEGDVSIEEGQIVLGQGNDMTGVTTTRRDLPTSNYEIRFEAARLLGNDFFAGLTFPVKKDPCSLILGGWGGATCGLSSIDGFDASENSTSTFQEFELKRWYSILLRVTDGSITAWIDGEKLLEQELEGRRISIRAEVELSRPLGFSTWRTTGAIRKVEMRTIDPTKPAPAASTK